MQCAVPLPSVFFVQAGMVVPRANGTAQKLSACVQTRVTIWNIEVT